jgi:hypothetical protein
MDYSKPIIVRRVPVCALGVQTSSSLDSTYSADKHDDTRQRTRNLIVLGTSRSPARVPFHSRVLGPQASDLGLASARQCLSPFLPNSHAWSLCQCHVFGPSLHYRQRTGTYAPRTSSSTVLSRRYHLAFTPAMDKIKIHVVHILNVKSGVNASFSQKDTFTSSRTWQNGPGLPVPRRDFAPRTVIVQ